MKGKIVNLCIGLMNIVFGILIIIFTVYVPQERILLTVQENYVIKNILTAIYVILGAVIFLNVIQYYNHRKDKKFNTAYMLALFVISFIFIKEPIISFFVLVSGLIIVFRSLKENLVEIDSTTAISAAIIVIVAIVITSSLCFMYANMAQAIRNKENKNELAYKNDYFKYITELEIEDVYINIKRDGKYGYINQNGDVVIDFKYDYASPFIKIMMYNKSFDIALVCIDGSSQIILKNERKVLSYRTESASENYNAKMEELENIYENILGQGGEIQTEIPKIVDNIKRAKVYEEMSSDYTYRYDYNEEYDLIVTQSILGLGDKYALAKKENIDIKVDLHTNSLAYDQNYLYLFSNGTIPFYELSQKNQGWFTSYGKKNTMTGKAQILEFIDDKILIRNYNDNTVYFINSSGNMLSEAYKDIFVCGDRYIVKNSNNKYKVIDKEFNKVFDAEYDVIDPYLSSVGMYICVNFDDEIKFDDYGYANIKWQLLNHNGEVILDNIEQIYGNYYQLNSDKSISSKEAYMEFLNNITDIEYNFAGDNFYSIY